MEETDKSISKNTTLLSCGTPPPQESTPKGLDKQDMFLYTAWIHGLKEVDIVDKHHLILFIQTHISNIIFSKLENILATSLFWEKDRASRYSLTKLGAAELSRFGEEQQAQNIQFRYLFEAEFEDKTYGIAFNTKGKRSTYISGHLTPAPLIIKRLKDTGIKFYSKSSWAPEIIHDWIMEDTEYTWKRSK